MSTSRPTPTPITDESKFQEKTINGKTVKFAQHDEDAKTYTVKTDEALMVVTVLNGATLDQTLQECLNIIEEKKQEAMIQMFMQHPELMELMFGLGGPGSTNGPATPGTSRFGAFGGSAPMNFGSDKSEEFRPRGPGL